MKGSKRQLLAVSGFAATLVFVGVGCAVAQTVGPNVNVSRLLGNQSEATVAINPTNPLNIVVISNRAFGGQGLFEGVSTDGGTTWTTRIIANGDALGLACCDPSLAFDSFGNLFLTYIDAGVTNIQLGLSTDSGNTFTLLFNVRNAEARFAAETVGTRSLAGVDQPTVVTGPGSAPGQGSVWVTYRVPGGIEARGAPVNGLGAVGTFIPPQFAPGSAGGNFGDIAVGAAGQILVTYQTPSGGIGPSNIFANLKPDGLGPNPFNAAVLVTSTNVGGFRPIPAQSRRTIDAEAGLAWDRSGGPLNGRVYLVYTDAPSVSSDDTDIFLRFSDDNGTTWSTPARVNDDTGTNSQFLPRIALDQTTGKIAVSWHDCRNDLGDFGPGDTNGIPNDDAQFFATASIDGVNFEPNVQVSAGTSNAAASGNPIDFGDYTGLDFFGGNFYPVWADNSNSTGDNPDGALSALDIYTGQVSLPLFGPLTMRKIALPRL